MISDNSLLLYDGTCGFCARTVQFVLSHERERYTLRFAALQSPCGDEVRRAYPGLAGIDSIVVLMPPADGRSGSVFVRSDAALAVAAYLGGGWRLIAGVARLVPRALRDALYDLVARHRYRLMPMRDSCLLPTPAQRRRFTDECPAT